MPRGIYKRKAKQSKPKGQDVVALLVAMAKVLPKKHQKRLRDMIKLEAYLRGL